MDSIKAEETEASGTFNRPADVSLFRYYIWHACARNNEIDNYLGY